MPSTRLTYFCSYHPLNVININPLKYFHGIIHKCKVLQDNGQNTRTITLVNQYLDYGPLNIVNIEIIVISSMY